MLGKRIGLQIICVTCFWGRGQWRHIEAEEGECRGSLGMNRGKEGTGEGE